ncbi:hypothetical protein HWD99_15335 [Microbacterium sp. C5A9]|uniref:hypothetical protein n=1 Tax=Microbacterium sp. C5A9 TaxID=2736663 RepID=UPI001F520AB3|nr:hypothetical protein [Microbacterium sp. C5A9]MCI1020002.1 hypothetical protein [Microbacterium sp. C5A9]
MSTSDQHGQGPLTRKQLREIRLTGSTPVITPEEAAAAAASAPPAPPVPPAAEPEETAPPAAPAPVEADLAGGVRLTRRQVRELERSRSGSDSESPADAPTDADAAISEEAPAGDDAPADDEPGDDAPADREPADDAPADDDLADDLDDEDITATPVSASARVDDASDVVLIPGSAEEDGSDSDEPSGDRADSDTDEASDAEAEEERPTVSSTFGQGVLRDEAEPAKPFTPSFDELLTVGDSAGSQHRGGNTLIFNPAPGDGSLSGPVASTGEILVTGSYELPKGLGSQGHAHGTTDGKEVDAVLIDGELPPASSPTPIAASAAVSTIKPAGEVIRPPAPEKGNKLMLILAIVAGGLALALGVALIVAFTGNVF